MCNETLTSFICHVTTWSMCYVLCGWGSLITSDHLAKFGVHRPDGNRNNGKKFVISVQVTISVPMPRNLSYLIYIQSYLFLSLYVRKQQPTQHTIFLKQMSLKHRSDYCYIATCRWLPQDSIAYNLSLRKNRSL